MIKTAGIDPGLASTGVGIVRGTSLKPEGHSFGVIRTSAKSPLQERLHELYSKLYEILVDEKPDIVILEESFSSKKNPKSGLLLGKVTGVIILAGHRAGTTVVEMAAREVKQILTGSGRAGKEQLEIAVRNLLNRSDPIRPSHASDALAMALIGMLRYGRDIESFKRR